MGIYTGFIGKGKTRDTGFKSFIAEDFAKQIEQKKGANANASAKKQKVLGRLAEDKRKAVANMDTYYREKLFAKPAKKKKKADKDESGKENKAEPDDKTLVLASKRVIYASTEDS